MTKEEAIEWLVSRKEHYEMDDNCQELAQALDMAIKALEQEPCDCISRKGVISQVEYVLSHPDSELRKGLEDTLRKAKTCISIQPKPDVLDKIRAEINSPNRGTCDYFIVDRIEEIINKYTAESEGKE